MTEALTLLVAIYTIPVAFVFSPFVAGGRADLRAQHELKRLVAGEGEGREPVHTHFDTTKG